MRFDLRGQMLEACLTEFSRELRGAQIAGAPEPKFAIRKDDHQDYDIGDEISLQLVEGLNRQTVEAVLLADNGVNQLSKQQDTRDMQRRKYQRRSHVRNDDAPAWMGIQSKMRLEAHHQGNEREDDDDAAEFPDQRLPGGDACTAQADQRIDA